MHDLRPNASGVVRAATPSKVAERDHVAAGVQDRPRRAAGRVVLDQELIHAPVAGAPDVLAGERRGCAGGQRWPVQLRRPTAVTLNQLGRL